jgi:hypothetical protein
MYFRKKTSGGRAYFQIVESRRDGAQVRQRRSRPPAGVTLLRREWQDLARSDVPIVDFGRRPLRLSPLTARFAAALPRASRSSAPMTGRHY